MTMMTTLMVAITVSIVLLLIQLAFIGADLRALRYRLLPDLTRAILCRGMDGGVCFPCAGTIHNGDDHNPGIPGLGCFVVWEWHGGKWRCRSVPDGFDPGLSPGYPGAFEGDLAKTWRPLKS